MIKVLYLAAGPEDTPAFVLDLSEFELTTASLVEEGIVMAISGGPFDCIVADAGIGESDLIEMLSRVRAMDANMPVVISSGGEIPPEYHITAIKHGADYCVPGLDEGAEVLPAILETLVEKSAAEPNLPAICVPDKEMEAARLRISELLLELGKGRVIIEKQLRLLKRNESELKKQKERLDFALESDNVGLWDIDLVSGERYINDGWFSLLGLEREDQADPVSEWESLLFPSDRDEVIGGYQRFMDGMDEAFGADYRMNCGDGKERWFSDCAIALSRDESGRPVRIIRTYVNIDRIKKAYGYLKEANKKMNLMSSIIRHDALNQVTGMMIFMDMLKELAKEDDELKNYLDQIDNGMNSIHDKLVFTRDYHGLGEYEPVWQDIRDVIREVMPDIEMEGISMDIDLDGLEIYADPLLRMAFMRLIENSVKHGEKATRIGISYEISADGCRIVMEDDGVGIPPDEKNQIFRNGYGKHAGYGLFLVQQILSITGISIEENGDEGQGARFEMLVPEGMFRLNPKSGESE